MLATEYIFCQSCLNTCPKEIPRITFGLAAGFRELLQPRAPRA